MYFQISEAPKFRILAPPFVCPKDKDAVIDKPDNTIVTLQTEPGEQVRFHWTVRWVPLDAPTQLLTLRLWRTVRELEFKLNQPQLEPNVYVINNTELLSGVNYTFNVTATSIDDEGGEETEQMFNIDNIKGDQKLMIEGRSEMFAITLVGGQMTYADLDFVLEAQFVWSVTSGGHEVNVSDIEGSRLELQANMLTPGLSYDVLAQVFKYSNGEFITQSSLPLSVQHRDLKVNFNVDKLLISADTPFSMLTDISKLDYITDGLSVTWECTFDGDPVYRFDIVDDGTLYFPLGLPDIGEYLITVNVGLVGQENTVRAKTRVIVVEASLPVIEVVVMPRILNENSVVTLNATVAGMAPGCSISWYFTSEDCLSELAANENCTDNEHGTPISEAVNFYSLEENFLSELTDYSNETGSKPVVADFRATAGRARVVAQCTCTNALNCSEGTVYAEVNFQINDVVDAGNVLVLPETGTAMETVFRISTLAIVDANSPLRYSFYSRLNGNDTVLLGSYIEHLAVEVLLPYIDGNTEVWVEICDSLGACSSGNSTVVSVSEGEARTVDTLILDAQAHLRRCELLSFQRLAKTALVTYSNSGQDDALKQYMSALQVSLGQVDDNCVQRNYEEYSKFLNWLTETGFQ
ncbi:unnamed protein product [Chrysodeixis includens]|uniref:PKD/REJ-like domain-containing protein n=1 Tax=Chrysodeixis includens TaxID=689277 RepID=A0A9N8KZ72_CHRIL|nr:unnamed protein product [Chrysodeixis includens]